MTPFKNYSEPGQWRKRLRRGGLYLAVAAMITATATSCSDNGSDWEDVTVHEPTQGVVTVIEEESDGKYSIVEEKVVGAKQDSRIIVRRLSGAVDTLTLDQARGLVTSQDTVYQNTVVHHHHGGLGSTIWWGAMGYMMGRSFSTPSPSYYYRPGTPAWSNNLSNSQQLRNTSISRTVRQPARGRSGFFGGSRSRSSGG